MTMQSRPRVFIGSSTEQLPVARAVNGALDHDAECSIWTYGFDPSKYTLESLEDEINKSDFAVFVLAADDLTVSRGRAAKSPRDNVVLELGISIGALRRRRTFVLVERGDRQRIPSDLMGLTTLTFERRQRMGAAVEAACNAIRDQIREQGFRLRTPRAENIISFSERSLISTGFAASTLRGLSTFAGDLSWLEDDLGTYQTLTGRHRNVDVRFLTDTPDAPAIKKGQKAGIQFRQYPAKARAPLKAALSDTDSETDARALIVRRYIPAQALDDGTPYQYWMKMYRGPEEYPVIRGLALLFDALWHRAKKL